MVSPQSLDKHQLHLTTEALHRSTWPSVTAPWIRQTDRLLLLNLKQLQTFHTFDKRTVYHPVVRSCRRCHDLLICQRKEWWHILCETRLVHKKFLMKLKTEDKGLVTIYFHHHSLNSIGTYTPTPTPHYNTKQLRSTSCCWWWPKKAGSVHLWADLLILIVRNPWELDNAFA